MSKYISKKVSVKKFSGHDAVELVSILNDFYAQSPDIEIIDIFYTELPSKVDNLTAIITYRDYEKNDGIRSF